MERSKYFSEPNSNSGIDIMLIQARINLRWNEKDQWLLKLWSAFVLYGCIWHCKYIVWGVLESVLLMDYFSSIYHIGWKVDRYSYTMVPWLTSNKRLIWVAIQCDTEKRFQLTMEDFNSEYRTINMFCSVSKLSSKPFRNW